MTTDFDIELPFIFGANSWDIEKTLTVRQ